MFKLLSLRTWLAVVLALLASTVVTTVVLAHATLLRSEPADNAVLPEAPREVRLWFSEAVSPEFSTAQILDINGQPIKISGIRVDPTEAELMILSLPELPSGLYSVRWKVLSEADGHFTQGLFVFGVGEAVDMAAAAVPEPGTSLPLPEVLLRWLNFSVLMALTGALGVAYLVLAPAKSSSGLDLSIATARRRVLGWGMWCSALALVVGLGLLIWQVVTLLGTLPEGVSIQGVGWQLLSRTRWGRLWLARQAIVLALIGVGYLLHRAAATRNRPPGGRLASPAAGLLALALILVQALTGHAAAVTPNTTLAVVVDALHLLAASLWVGGLLAVIIGLMPLIRRSRTDFAALVRAGWGPFGRVAAPSVGILFATGLYNTGRQVASLDALITTLYGQVLLGKIGLMLAVGAFGLLNSMLLHPDVATPLARLLRRPPRWTPLSLRRLPALVLVEATLGLLVLLATGVITASPQARGPEFGPVTEELPTALTQSVDDLVVTFAAKPNQPGQNVFTVRAVSTRRPPPAEIMRVILRFTFLGQETGRVSADAREIEPGFYQVGGGYLSLTGPWQIDVVVRRKGIEDSVAPFDWTVPPPGPSRRAILSSRPLEPLLTVVAALIILLIPSVMAGAWLMRGQFTEPIRNWHQTQVSGRGFHGETDHTRKTNLDAYPASEPGDRWLQQHQRATKSSLRSQHEA